MFRVRAGIKCAVFREVLRAQLTTPAAQHAGRYPVGSDGGALH